MVTQIWSLGIEIFLSIRDEKKDMLNHIKARMPARCFFRLKINGKTRDQVALMLSKEKICVLLKESLSAIKIRKEESH